ncbi:UNVERIFIED_CONTAM: hypothetical protein HDU68_011224 [Siphonaria sp. JEL0065]|nr:hypothetical protein HDU68_011224 [Siphonaria sp. JEL0065]
MATGTLAMGSAVAADDEEIGELSDKEVDDGLESPVSTHVISTLQANAAAALLDGTWDILHVLEDFSI